jgi:hypothetical protein
MVGRFDEVLGCCYFWGFVVFRSGFMSPTSIRGSIIAVQPAAAIAAGRLNSLPIPILVGLQFNSLISSCHDPSTLFQPSMYRLRM